MCVYHGCCNIFMTEQLLDGPDIVASLKQVGRETMSKSMDIDGFMEADEACRGPNGALQNSLADMVTSLLAGSGID